MILTTFFLAAAMQQGGAADRPPIEPTPIEVVVRDGPTGRPVPGAEVWTGRLPLDAPRALDRRASGLSSMDGWLAEVGEQQVSDAEGRVHFVLTEEHQMIAAARAGERWGFGRWYVNDALREITIWPDNEIEIRVRHADGRPAVGVPLTIRMLRGERRMWGYRLPETDAEGRAVALHLDPLTMGLADRASGWMIEAEVPTSVPAEVRYVPGATVGLLEIALPRVGSLDVELVCAPGLRIDPDGWVTAAAHGLPRTVVGARLGFGVPSGTEHLDADGHARFPHVEVGLDLDLEVRFPESKSATTARALGPVRDGEAAHAQVIFGSDFAVVRARVVDAAGAPMAGANLYVIVGEMLASGSGFQTQEIYTLTTDAHGRFLVPVRMGELLAPEDALELIGTREMYRFANVYWPMPTDPLGPESHHGVLDLSKGLPAGVTDRGDLVLSPAAALAAGRVVDVGGEPVADIEVRVFPSGETGPELPPISSFEAKTDPAGRFVVYGHLPYPRLELTLAGRSVEGIVVPRGATAVELTYAYEE